MYKLLKNFKIFQSYGDNNKNAFCECEELPFKMMPLGQFPKVPNADDEFWEKTSTRMEGNEQ
jgi:hypothetical protein